MHRIYFNLCFKTGGFGGGGNCVETILTQQISQIILRTSKVSKGPCQCWGKLLLKVMHYNIAVLSKKVTNYMN